MKPFIISQVALRISTGYIVLGIFWVWGSDWLVLHLKSNPDTHYLTLFQSVKGTSFILFSGFLLYALLRKSYLRFYRSEMWYRKLFNESPIPKLVFDKDTFSILDANKAAFRQYGYPKEEFLQQHLKNLCPSDEHFEQWKESLQYSGPSRNVVPHMQKDGTFFYTQSFPAAPIHKGSPARLLVVLNVHEKIITEQKHQEAEREIKKLSLVARETQNTVIITDKEGNIEWVNEAFTRQTGYQLEEVLGKKPGSFLQGPLTNMQTVEFISNSLRKQKKFKAELINYRKDNSVYWVRMFITPVLDEHGTLEQFIAVESDITERMEIIEKLEKQNVQLRKIAWISSHEIRRPVATILGLISLYNPEHPTSPLNQELIQHLHTTTQELDGVIHKIVHKTYEIQELETPYRK